jgi:FkbM family methyltransferase
LPLFLFLRLPLFLFLRLPLFFASPPRKCHPERSAAESKDPRLPLFLFLRLPLFLFVRLPLFFASPPRKCHPERSAAESKDPRLPLFLFLRLPLFFASPPRKCHPERVRKISETSDSAPPKMGLWGKPVWTHSRLWNHVKWDESVLQWITEYLKPGDVFFDVGSHQGWLSMAAAGRVGRAGKVVAFEPSPELVKYLRFHKRVNRLAQMEIVSKAVTKDDAPATPFILRQWQIYPVSAIFQETLETRSVSLEARIQLSKHCPSIRVAHRWHATTNSLFDNLGKKLFVKRNEERIIAS